jgi:hypothetical protein
MRKGIRAKAKLKNVKLSDFMESMTLSIPIICFGLAIFFGVNFLRHVI